MSRWLAVLLVAMLVTGCGAAETSPTPAAAPTATPATTTPTLATTTPTPASPAFHVSGLRLASTPTEILTGDRVEYLVDVANTGTQAGTYDATLSVNGTVASRQGVPLDVGQTTTLHFVIEAGAPGVHTVEVGDARATHTVLEPASVALSALRLTTNPAETGGKLAAAVTVGNQGGATGTFTVNVTIDDEDAATQKVTLAGGELTTVEIPLAVPGPGRHTVAVGELEEELVVWKITRPANGTVLVNKIKGGMGRLTIKNGDDERDVVLVLAKSSSPSKALLAVYVRANKSRTVKGIKDGTYVVYFTFGERWDSYSKAFTSFPEKRRFEGTIRFRTTRTSTAVRYSVVTISLHQAGGESAPTDPVGDEDFPTVP